MLDYGGKPCQGEKDYKKDLCTQHDFENRSLEDYGCTSPFGPNKTRICEDPDSAKKILQRYHKVFDISYFDENTENDNQQMNKEYQEDECLSPCKFVMTKAAITKKTKQDDYVDHNGRYQSLWPCKNEASNVPSYSYCRRMKNSIVRISLKEKVKVTTAQKIYSGWYLVADVGGYIGLFLGYSFQELTDLLKIVVQYVSSHY